MDQFRIFFATSCPTKRREHDFCLLCSQYCVCYFLNFVSNPNRRSPSKKTIPGLPRLEPRRKVNATTLYRFSQTFETLRKTANLFSNLDFLPKSEFPKTLDLSMDFPMNFHGFPTPWILGEAAGAADKKCGGTRPPRRPDQRAGPTSAQTRPASAVIGLFVFAPCQKEGEPYH